MDNHEFEDLGKKMQDIVDNAVNSNSYHELSHTINQTVNKAIDSGSEALKNAMNSVFEPGSDPQFRKRSYTYQSPYYGKSKKAKQQAAKKQTELLYGKTTGENLKGMMMAVSGGILLSGMGLGAMVLLIWMGLGHSGALAAGVLGVMCAGAAGGGALLGAGTSRLGRLGRFQKYIRALGDHTYCNFQKLAQAAGKNEKFVKKDISRMIEKGWFLEGHVDAEETCLITSNETYQQYTQTQKALEEKKKEEAADTTNTNNDDNDETNCNSEDEGWLGICNEIAKVLNLSETATGDDILKAVTDLKTDFDLLKQQAAESGSATQAHSKAPLTRQLHNNQGGRRMDSKITPAGVVTHRTPEGKAVQIPQSDVDLVAHCRKAVDAEVTKHGRALTPGEYDRAWSRAAEEFAGRRRGNS